MAIVVSQLVSAAILQNYLEDKSAVPLSAGIVTFYEDSNHTILKNVYQQTGVAGAYNYIAAPNPMTLSAAGTFTDQNGNDILLFYYPWDENDSAIAQPYFVTVYNANGQLQFTRSGFPFVPDQTPSPTNTNFVTQENYIVNNRFWRNVGSLVPGSSNSKTWTTQYNSSGTVAYWTLCPDQHDGFSMPDFNYIVPNSDVGNATETITFSTFAGALQPVIQNDIEPEYYINHVCTADSGTYTKIYQFPISLHLATLANQPFSFTIQGMGAIDITVSIYAFTGTGNPTPVPTVTQTFSLGSSWTKFTFNSSFPSNLGAPTTTTKDDAYYLQISFASGAVDFSFAIPSLYIYDDTTAIVDGNQLFSFATYDQIDSVVASPRTGDVKISLNNFYPFGWVPLSGGTIAIPGSVTPPTNLTIAYQGYDAWPLFNMLWTMFSPYTLNGSELVQIYSSGGSPTIFGASASEDWAALKQIQLNQTMGQVLLGTVPINALTQKYSTTFTASSSSGLLVTTANSVSAFRGMPITFSNSGGTLPTGLAANTVYYVTADSSFSSNSFHVSINFANAMAGTPISYTDSGSGTQTVTMAVTGTSEGEYAHKQLNGEVGSHLHGPGGTATQFYGLGSGAVPNPTGTPGLYSNFGTTALNQAAGSVVAANVTQPGTFFNMFMKL